ncbi:MAG: hypothetical protein ACRCX2_21325 [Paraclostridium sp.]
MSINKIWRPLTKGVTTKRLYFPYDQGDVSIPNLPELTTAEIIDISTDKKVAIADVQGVIVATFGDGNHNSTIMCSSYGPNDNFWLLPMKEVILENPIVIANDLKWLGEIYYVDINDDKEDVVFEGIDDNPGIKKLVEINQGLVLNIVDCKKNIVEELNKIKMLVEPLPRLVSVQEGSYTRTPLSHHVYKGEFYWDSDLVNKFNSTVSPGTDAASRFLITVDAGCTYRFVDRNCNTTNKGFYEGNTCFFIVEVSNGSDKKAYYRFHYINR